MKRLYPALALLASLVAVAAHADEDFQSFVHRGQNPTLELPGGFTFVRVQYASEGGYGESWYNYDGRTWQRWETDYPEAEENFLFRLNELSTVNPNPKAISLPLTDPRLLDYPFLYMCDPGWMVLTSEEKQCLRRYLDHGGFLWVDDFWGYAEWMALERAMRDVLPDIQWTDLPKNHPILQAPFRLEECPQIPAKDFAEQGWPYDPPWIHREPTAGRNDLGAGVEQVHFRGLVDKNGRMLVLATHNTDVGDGWEREAEDETYFQKYSTKSFAMGVNVIVYALTH